MTTDNHIRTTHYHANVARLRAGPRWYLLIIKLEHVRMAHRDCSTACTRRSHLTYAAYKRVFHCRGGILRMNPDSGEGTLNFWPLRPCRKGEPSYPMPDRLKYDGTEP
jgi:hypothetical protein